MSGDKKQVMISAPIVAEWFFITISVEISLLWFSLLVMLQLTDTNMSMSKWMIFSRLSLVQEIM
jgi:hypothetical protein